MSMLAERKRKQKWSLNPRGKYWSEDTNKFGQKLLEKMGWKHGKGLGLKEDGMVEHVKISYKNDSRGMGYSEQTEQWTEHQENFNKLLENLKGDKCEDDDKKEKVSLEEKSMKSRVRVHYHKFTRGKDLSKYSAKDLANILGKKTLDETPKKAVQTVTETDKETNIEEEDAKKSFGVETVKGGCMADYFKKKLPNFSMNSNSYNIGSNGVLQTLKTEAYSDTELERPTFGFGFSMEATSGITTDSTEDAGYNKKTKSLKDSFVSFTSEKQIVKNENEEIVDSTSESMQEKCKSKNLIKKEKQTSNFISYIKEEEITAETLKVDETSKTKKKKKRKSVADTEQELTRTKRIKLEPQEGEEKKSKQNDLGISNPAFDPLSRSFVVEKHLLQPINEDAIEPMEAEEEQEAEAMKERATKKSKKNKNKSNGIVNHVDIPIEDEPVDGHANNAFELKETKRKTKKRKARNEKIKEETFAIDNPCFDTQTDAKDEFIGNTFEVKETKRKSKKNKDSNEDMKEESYAMDNPCFDPQANRGEIPNNDAFEVKEPKRKGKKQRGSSKEEKEESYAVDNPCFDPQANGAEKLDDNVFEVKRRKKKNKKQTEEVIDNIPTTENGISIECDLMLNVSNTVMTPVETTRQSDEEPTRKSSSKRRKSVRFSDVHEERIIPNNEELQEMSNNKDRMDLYDINTEVIENGLIEQAKRDGKKITVNAGINLRSIDRISFYAKKSKNGIENVAFNENAVRIEESVNGIKKRLDNYQAEIENDINEAKDEHRVTHVGLIGSNKDEHERTADGTLLAFKHAKFGKDPNYVSKIVGGPKKSYKHLIKGDVIVMFPRANLHQIVGYGNDVKNKV